MNTPVPVLLSLPGGALALSIVVGDHHACATANDGKLYCWGGNESGQLGGNSIGGIVSSPSPLVLPGVTRIVAGQQHTCALAAGDTYCWGRNIEGQVGNLSATQLFGTPQLVATGAHIDLAAGGNSTCAIALDHTAQCWGVNDVGQLGDGSFVDRQGPVAVSLGRAYASISMGARHSCAIRMGGAAVDCWGDNSVGELADVSVARFSTIPNTVPTSAETYSTIVSGIDFSCALSAPDLHVYCWGSQAAAAKGTFVGSRDFPLGVLGGLHFVQVAVGEQHACGITDDGQAWCWGSNAYGQLGNSALDPTVGWTSPQPVEGSTVFTAISAGRAHTCAIDDNRRVWCWGANRFGQLGNGSNGEVQFTPVQIGTIGGVHTIGAGGDHTCAGVDNESPDVYCWGDNRQGQVGIGSALASFSSPTRVNVPDQLRGYDVAVGGRHSCVVAGPNNALRVYCWGANDLGQLGDLNAAGSQIPVPITGVDNFPNVVSGKNHNCAYGVIVYCWGDNSAIQVGAEGPGRVVITPVPVLAGAIDQVFAGASADHTCALLLLDHVPVCWGSLNTRGQMGNQTGQTRPSFPTYPSTP